MAVSVGTMQLTLLRFEVALSVNGMLVDLSVAIMQLEFLQHICR